jgi:hypothetical protein
MLLYAIIFATLIFSYILGNLLNPTPPPPRKSLINQYLTVEKLYFHGRFAQLKQDFIPFFSAVLK